MKKELIYAILCNFYLYLIQFLLIPAINFNWVTDDTKMIVTLCLSTILVSIIGMLSFTTKLHYWLSAIFIYAICIFLYSPKYAYDIGIIQITLDELSSRYDPSFRYFGIMLITALVLFLQLSTCLIIKVIRQIRYHFK